ncbi:hypothetical protein [Roseibium aggregatum]|uniref:Uncharacterized protein n=1 Tax=Roseibium aggregatum TaxID=187304 RepID=A0A926S8U4_9HYPH|nr:hypothetical protein [Roseibium aggregatum]MBD1549337.1 hypothetical protein [Roseibium aggregatum]
MGDNVTRHYGSENFFTARIFFNQLSRQMFQAGASNPHKYSIGKDRPLPSGFRIVRINPSALPHNSLSSLRRQGSSKSLNLLSFPIADRTEYRIPVLPLPRQTGMTTQRSPLVPRQENGATI